MTGADIAGALLLADATLLAKVPVERIKGGALPDGIPLPALLVRVVSRNEQKPLKKGGLVRKWARVSVTVRAKSYREQGEVIAIVEGVLRGRTGNIGGGTGVSIAGAGTGPDLRGPADSFEQATDVRISFEDPT